MDTMVAGCVVDDFAAWLGERKAARTAEAYRQDVGAFAVWAAGRYDEVFELAMFNRSDLRLFAEEQMVVVAPASWNRRRAALRVFAQWAMGCGLLSYDPSDVLPVVEQVDLAPRWLDGREIGKVERALERAIQGAGSEAALGKALRDRAITLLMLKGGLREGEVCALASGDLVLGERKGRVTIRLGKGGKMRVVPLNFQVVGAIRAYMNHVGEVSGAVFVGKGGVRLQERGVQRLVAELGRLAGVEGLTPHRLRHSCAKCLLDAGAQLTEVAKLLGHSRLDTTMRYVQPSALDLERAVERI